MNEELNTADDILAWFKLQAERKVPIDPIRYLEAATKLQILASDEVDKLIDLEHQVAKIRTGFLESSGTAAKAKMQVESTDTFVLLRKQQAKCKTIEEMVRLAKKFATLTNDQMRTGL